MAELHLCYIMFHSPFGWQFPADNVSFAVWVAISCRKKGLYLPENGMLPNNGAVSFFTASFGGNGIVKGAKAWYHKAANDAKQEAMA